MDPVVHSISIDTFELCIWVSVCSVAFVAFGIYHYQNHRYQFQSRTWFTLGLAASLFRHMVLVGGIWAPLALIVDLLCENDANVARKEFVLMIPATLKLLVFSMANVLSFIFDVLRFVSMFRVVIIFWLEIFVFVLYLASV